MIMKYFTNDWFFSKLSEDEIDRISDEYWAYIDSIFEKLPFTLKILSKSINLHDGIVVNTNFNRESHLLKLDFFCGDLQSGYFLLQLEYSGISDQSKNVDRFEPYVEIFTDELEIVGINHFIHRILLSNKIEVQMEFSDLIIKIVNKTPEDFDKINISN